jgi:hypothetical protein
MAFSASVTTCYFLVYEAVDGIDVAASDSDANEENSDDEQMEITNSDSENDGA